MPLSWNEIRERALSFSREWADESSEDAEAKSFWDSFFNVFGITRRRVASFEEPVRKSDGKGGYIDLLWKGTLLVEHKSRGKDLDRAWSQAKDYFPGLAERDLPRYVLVSDFARLRLYDLDADTQHQFDLVDLHHNVKHFAFIAGYAPQEIRPQDPVNIRAAEQMGKLHDLLKAAGYTGHQLEVLLVRLVFCLFADDTGIFPKQSLRAWIEERTSEDGSDLGPKLAMLFQVLDTPREDRQKNLDEDLQSFEYVNGQLFSERLQLASFDTRMRATLLDCCALDWGRVSPAIFGALFQSIMDEAARRNLGGHYTSEENILKVIGPLFLDDLKAELRRVKSNRTRLLEFHRRLRGLTFLDPACGCGNFLVITYRELRLLELEVLHAVHRGTGSRFLDVHQEVLVDVDQFYGIEIEEFPAQIAQVALWLVDHQMNLRVSEAFGTYYARIPLRTAPHIVNGNALDLDWNSVLSSEHASFVMGNPPFVGKQYQSQAQKRDMARVFHGVRGAGVLDLVAAWYMKAARYVAGRTTAVAFVSTNSITQGEQVGVLWGALLPLGVHITFGHRTFQWTNEAPGLAAVHCVIIGFSMQDSPKKVIYEYDDVRGAPHAVQANRINPYLVDAPDILLRKRRAPVCTGAPAIAFGNMPNDGGFLILDDRERDDLLSSHPSAAPYTKILLGSEEFINGGHRWCLWLVDVPPTEIRKITPIAERLDCVRRTRLNSQRAITRRLADTPALFGEIRQPRGPYLAIPEVSSENRRYIPIGFLPGDVIATNKLYTIENGGAYDFGVLSSTMHMAWTRAVCGRLESRYQYSAGIVYNNFPWPPAPSRRAREKVEIGAAGVREARALYRNASLADLYDPATMPADLVKAHRVLDAAVDAAYGRKVFRSEAERVGFLLELLAQCLNALPME